MSYAWGFLKTDKQTRLAGAVLVGIFLCFIIGIPLLKTADYYESEAPIWLRALFIIIVFPSVTFFTYKMVSRRKSKK